MGVWRQDTYNWRFYVLDLMKRIPDLCEFYYTFLQIERQYIAGLNALLKGLGLGKDNLRGGLIERWHKRS